MKDINSKLIVQELQWLEQLIQLRLQLYFEQGAEHNNIYELSPPDVESSNCLYGHIVQHYQFGFGERLILILALAPHVAPQVLDPFFIPNSIYNRPYSEFGGGNAKNHRGFLPTAETVFFLLAGGDIESRLAAQQYFQDEHPFFRYQILKMAEPEKGEPKWSSIIGLSEEYLSYLTLGGAYEPTFSSSFPAKKITSRLEWSDLVLNESIKREIEEIGHWITNQQTILEHWGYQKHLKPGYRSLFFGPPGTGKSLTAILLGKMTQMEVYRIDLSQVISKYIGETEKNLASVFDIAVHKNWILFFDEADALFGRRTAAKDAKDRYANQEVAYLLQRIEDFPGIVILATNLKMNIDQAFSRRFQSIIHFPMPNAKQRLRLWKNVFSSQDILDRSVKLEPLAIKYELSGGAIINVLRYCALLAVQRDPPRVMQTDLERGVIREMAKDGKVVG